MSHPIDDMIFVAKKGVPQVFDGEEILPILELAKWAEDHAIPKMKDDKAGGDRFDVDEALASLKAVGVEV
jgi:hypothetical protein